MTRRILVLLAVVLPILFVVVPADAAAPRTVADTVGRELDALAPPAAAYVVVAPDGTPTVGTHGKGVTARTPFVLGSLSKSFTALSVMQLVDRGKVALDQPVTAYLPWLRTATPGRVPTIRQLLDQSSGLPTAAGVADVTHPGRTLEQRVRRIVGVTPTAVPGARFQYCNLNFATLGLVVQTVSGQPYASYLRTNVLDPLGMSRTYTSIPQARTAGLVEATVPWFGIHVRSPAADFPGALPDGYLVSTAEDLGHYLTMQLGDGTYQGHELVSPASMRLLHQRQVAISAADADPHTDGYALGWYTGAVNGTPLVSHSGDVFGFHNDIGLLPGRHTALAVLTAQNSNLLANDDAYAAGLEVLAGQPAPAIGFFDHYRNRYLIIDLVFAALLALMAGRWVALIRRPRPRGARRAALGLAGSVAAAGIVYVAVVYGLGHLIGFPLQPDLMLGGIPELLVLTVLLAAYPILTSVLKTAVPGTRLRSAGERSSLSLPALPGAAR
ncbi:serine hydrolase domain-containing protein [Actinoplanes sp. NPDC051411]|uniref:serine hydrolase domain-containing protein n=1 Tax=Actinoplanes sp. NPDC051411 TaxID=3155522 RepID=UPI00343BC04D